MSEIFKFTATKEKLSSALNSSMMYRLRAPLEGSCGQVMSMIPQHSFESKSEDNDGKAVGNRVGLCVGGVNSVGRTVGEGVGFSVEDSVGEPVGSRVGITDGTADGSNVGGKGVGNPVNKGLQTDSASPVHISTPAYCTSDVYVQGSADSVRKENCWVVEPAIPERD